MTMATFHVWWNHHDIKGTKEVKKANKAFAKEPILGPVRGPADRTRCLGHVQTLDFYYQYLY